MNKGVIYILTNPSFPDYVKIGYADNLESRLEQLNRSECIPFAFRAFATFEVDERLSDLKIHDMIDKLNPNLRSIDKINGKQRKREFYALSPEDAYSILRTIAELGGRLDRLHLFEMNEEEKKAEEIAQDVEEASRDRKSPFSFTQCGIEPGERIVFICRGNPNSGTEFTVLDDKNVETANGPSTLSKLATILTGSKWGVAGPRYFKYNGLWLNEIRAQKEGRPIRTRIEDVWVIPCNPKIYDVVGAFSKFSEIEWTQTTNTNVGDTVFIYVSGKYQSIMFKTSVISVDNYGKGSMSDFEFFADKSSVGKERKYMVLRLLESYESGRFPLNELKEFGLTSVQGKTRATSELNEYLNSKLQNN